MTQKVRRLGRGLSSLIPTPTPVQVETIQKPIIDPSHDSSDITRFNGVPRGGPEVRASGRDGSGIRMIDVDEVRPSPFQARRTFAEGALEQLVASIRRSGLMQPIIVRPVESGGYELVAGERRWRAARMAGLGVVPAVVRDLGDEDAAEWGLVENIQREDLNPIERAHGLRTLAERFGLSHAELGERVGLDRSTVANLVRLTELEEEIQALVASGALSMGHARALLGVDAGERRLHVARRASEGSWSVRETEAAVRDGAAASKSGAASGSGGGVASANAGQTQRAAIIGDLERRIAEHLGTKAHIRLRPKGNRGRLVVEFYSLEHFEDVMQRLGLPDESIT